MFEGIGGNQGGRQFLTTSAAPITPTFRPTLFFNIRAIFGYACTKVESNPHISIINTPQLVKKWVL